MKLRFMCIMMVLLCGATVCPGEIQAPNHELVWGTPSKDEHGSMPLGNGRTGVNAWAQDDGTLHFYLSRNDAWSGNGRLLKLGRVEVRFDPNPFADDNFEQVLDIVAGEMRVRTRDFQLTLWVDAHDDLVRMEANSDTPRTMTVTSRPWRTEEREVDCSAMTGEVHSFFNLRNGPRNAVIRPDIILDAADALLWCHHNDQSLWEENLRGQALGDLVENQSDPLLHRSFGVLVQGDGLLKQDKMTLQSEKPQTQMTLTARTHTGFYEQPEAWAAAIRTQSARPVESARRAHRAWWNGFNERSFIMASASKSAQGPARLIKEPAGQCNIGTCQQNRFGFNGAMAWLKIYDKALTPEQIDQQEPQPHADFDFSTQAAGKPGVYPDRQNPSRTARNRVNTRPVTVDGHTGVAFDGKSHLAVPNTEGLLPAQAVTLDVLVHPGKQHAMGGRIFDYSTLYAKPSEGLLVDTYPGNSLRLIAPFGNLSSKPNALTPSRWHRVTAFYDAAAGKAALYLNGDLIAEKTFEPVEETEGGESAISRQVRHLSQNYALQRYMNACAGRGDYPIKFNGSIFTVSGNVKGEEFDPDYRRWGEPYWFQNTRLPYWSMLASGDHEFMMPLFRMYLDAMDTARYRAEKFYTAEGAMFPETIMFWGTSPLYIYGWPEQRAAQNLPDGLIRHPMHRYHWTAGIELAALMLEYYRYTGDEAFARDKLVPFSRDIVMFYRSHYPTNEEGKLVFEPSQALESWWDTVNPMPEVAGLRFLLEGLLALPSTISDTRQKDGWREMLGMMPELPTRMIDGKPAIWVADKTPVKPKNIENPELYAVFPFKLVSVGQPDIEMGLRAFEARRAKLSSGWSQDDIQAALLGLTDEAANCVLERANDMNPKERFPVFWGPNYDWVPDQDHGSVLLTALQRMVLQSVGDRLLLFPAWPAEWNLTFRLHAPQSTTVSGEIRESRLVALDVMPRSRLKDIEIMGNIAGGEKFLVR